MWRSMVARRASLTICCRLTKSRSIQSPCLTHQPQVQVPHYQTQATVDSSFPSPEKISPFFQNPRFFSHGSSDPADHHDGIVEPHFESLVSGMDDGLSLSDRDSVLGENPISELSESADKYDGVVESHFESPVSGMDDGLSDRDSVLGENPVSELSESAGNEPSWSLDFDEAGGGAEGFASGGDEKLLVEEDEVREVDFEQLESVLSLLQSSSASIDGPLESSLDDMDFTLHQEFVVSVLETPLVPGENLIAFFKWVLKKPEFSVTSWSLEALARAISSGLRKKDAYALWDLIKEIGEKETGVLKTGILNELISQFSKLGKGKAAFEVFSKFGEFGCVADAETYYYTIEALCRRSFFDWACSVCEKMISAGTLPGSEKVGKVLSFLCKGAKAKDAHSVYLLAKEKGIFPPRSSVNFLIGSLCCEDDNVCLALEMLEDFSREERKYAVKPFSSVVRGLCRIKDVEGAKNLLFKMIDAGPPPGNAIFNSIINGLSKAGDMEEARKLMQLMESRGLKPDVYTYSVIMSGYVKGGEMEEAGKVLAEAKMKHSKLSPVTYHTLIRGYCKLEEFDKALKLLDEMEEYGVHPNADEYNKLIQSLCLKALDWGTAEKLMEKMKENGLHLNGITKGLIRAVKELEEEEVETGEVTVAA